MNSIDINYEYYDAVINSIRSKTQVPSKHG